MIADIHIGNNLYGALAYNQQKIDAGQGKILEANRIFVPADGRFSIGDCVRDFDLAMPGQVTTTRGIIHISLNPHPDDKLTDEQLSDIGREYIERMGFGDQPYMVFKHEDIDRQHLHIVSTRVRGDGTLISDKNNYEKSRKITDDLERKYGLHSKEKRQGEVWQLAPVDAAAGNLKRQVSNAIKSLAETYRFQSFGEYRALLSLYSIEVEKVEGDNKGHRYTGLVYSALDKESNRVGKPLKSSLFGKKYGIEALEEAMRKSGEAVKAKGIIADTRVTVAASISKAEAGKEFRAELQKKGIDLVLRRNDAGRIYGATFIDHNSRTVLNGSALGKDFAANALAERFTDLVTESRGNRQQPISIPIPAPAEKVENIRVSALRPTNEASRPVTHLSSDNQRAAAISVVPDLSPIGDAAGSLFSILTPEPGGQPDDQPAPKRIQPKKKKPKQGQSW